MQGAYCSERFFRCSKDIQNLCPSTRVSRTVLEAISKAPEYYDSTSEPQESEEVFDMSVPPYDEASEVAQPSEQSFDLPASTVAAQRSAVLRGHL